MTLRIPTAQELSEVKELHKYNKSAQCTYCEDFKNPWRRSFLPEDDQVLIERPPTPPRSSENVKYHDGRVSEPTKPQFSFVPLNILRDGLHRGKRVMEATHRSKNWYSYRDGVDKNGNEVLVEVVAITNSHLSRTKNRGGPIDHHSELKERGKRKHDPRNYDVRTDRRLSTSTHSRKVNAQIPRSDSDTIILCPLRPVPILFATERKKTSSDILPLQPSPAQPVVITPMPSKSQRRESSRGVFDNHDKQVSSCDGHDFGSYPTRTSSKAPLIDLHAEEFKEQEKHVSRNDKVRSDPRSPAIHPSKGSNNLASIQTAEGVKMASPEVVHIVSQTAKSVAAPPPAQPLISPTSKQAPIPNPKISRQHPSEIYHAHTRLKLESSSGRLPPIPPAPEPSIAKRAPIHDAKTLDEYQRNASALAAHIGPSARKALHKQGSFSVDDPSAHAPRRAPVPPRPSMVGNEIGDMIRSMAPAGTGAVENTGDQEELGNKAEGILMPKLGKIKGLKRGLKKGG